MTSIPDTIEQYEQSREALRLRVAMLNDKISGRSPLADRESYKSLEVRRRHLYVEISEMEEAISLMRTYERVF